MAEAREQGPAVPGSPSKEPAMKRERSLCVRLGPLEDDLVRRLHLALGGGAHSLSETFREAAVLLSAFLLEERPPPITYQRERRRRQQIQERLLRRAAALGSGHPVDADVTQRQVRVVFLSHPLAPKHACGRAY